MYTSARVNKKTEQIEVVSRINGKRVFESWPIDYSFYIDAENGQDRSLYNTPVTKVTPRSSSEFHKELAILKNSGKRVWQSDLNPVFKCLATNYRHQTTFEPNILLFDIEVAYDLVKGYASPDDSFNPITSITVKLRWLGKMVTLAVPPSGMSMDKAVSIASKFTDTYMFETEEEMIGAFLQLIEDADVISGWNSEGFDIPYLVNRISRVMSSNDTRNLCLWGEKPKAKTLIKYGNELNTYELVGRTHLDMLEVYRKYTYEERHSYALDAIAQHELGKSKTPYSGSLDALYNKDFELFIEYNRQDVQLLDDLEDKLKFISLLNDVAHDTTTLLTTCMGTVAAVDQAIINRAHDHGFVVPNKTREAGDEEGDGSAAGAYVAPPKEGIHEYVGVIDINSLYPSAIRALNMGIETIVGQMRPTLTDQFIADRFEVKGMTYAHAWEGQFGSQEYQAVMAHKPGVEIIIDWESNGGSDTLTAQECYDLIFNSDQPWMLSGNGTIFTYEREAMIPGLLAQWYKERKEFQRMKDEAKTPEETSYYDRRQLVQKILLNSTYGATLSPSCRFYDKRFGQSVTLTGRVICHHMNSYVNECITGEYEVDGQAIIAADTDSSQFSAYAALKPRIDTGEIVWDKDTAVQFYLAIGEKVNDSFPDFMAKAFHCPEEYGSIIKGSCESVGLRGLYITKKRYAILNYFKDGKRYDEKPKLKAMGLDLRRSDTPVVCQDFLKEILLELLKGGTEHQLIHMINEFRDKFKKLPLHEQGTPKRINKLTYYAALIKKGKGNRVPGHVRAAINWNNLRDINKDKTHTKILDGMKCVVCPLKHNSMDMSSIAYPIDEVHLPKWFASLPFDSESMLASVVDKKIENLFSKLPSWKHIKDGTRKLTTFDDFFS